MSEHTITKANRLIDQRRILIRWWSADVTTATVHGDSGVYEVTIDPAGGWCTCPAGLHYRPCSHVRAVEVAAHSCAA